MTTLLYMTTIKIPFFLTKYKPKETLASWKHSFITICFLAAGMSNKSNKKSLFC